MGYGGKMMSCHDVQKFGAVVEFDLILERPGKWILKSRILPEKGFWFVRQREAMSYATWASRAFETMIIRLHNQYQ